MLVPIPINDTSAMRRSRPHRRHSVASMLAPSSRKTSGSAYAGMIVSTRANPVSAGTTSGRNAVTARWTGSAIHHHAIHTSNPMLARTGYGTAGNGLSASSRKTAGPPSV